MSKALSVDLRERVVAAVAAGASCRAAAVRFGPKPAATLAHLAGLGILDPTRILDGLPHPSGANAERISYFLGRKPRAALSSNTRPEPIDEARERLIARIALLAAAA